MTPRYVNCREVGTKAYILSHPNILAELDIDVSELAAEFDNPPGLACLIQTAVYDHMEREEI